jgi:rhamnulokinase
MSTFHYLGVDLGAESGRVMLGTLAEGRLELEEIHRFPNIVHKGARLTWDLPELEKQIFAGLEKAAQRGLPIAGISADSWAVDYVLLDAQGRVMAPAVCYRDARNEKSPDRLFSRLPFAEIYAETGIQFLVFNTLFQFEAERNDPASLLPKAAQFLTIADYFNERFSGVGAIEQSMASTTQLYNPQTEAWSPKLIATLGVPGSIFPRIVPSATVLGPVVKELARHEALGRAQVIATCSHDTGAAVAAVPASGGDDWVYLSSGTWSQHGAELRAPVMTEAARAAGFTNEVGVGGTIRFLKNIAGLWVVQECRRAWEAAGKNFSYEELTRLAAESGPAKAHLSLLDKRFVSAGGMPEKIAAFCRETKQPVPATEGEIVRTVLESLALSYARTLRELEKLAGHPFRKLHIVGGGSRSRLLNQLAADATGLEVQSGPVEATAIGNMLIQALALGHLRSLGDLRRIVAASFPTESFTPGAGFSGETRGRFEKLHER